MPLPKGPVVGTCGFSYQEWRGHFYPPELPQGEWLRFYAEVFEGVELDGTFYRPPERAVVASWAAALPDRFALAAKVPRAITHEARLEGEAAAAMLRAFARSLDPLAWTPARGASAWRGCSARDRRGCRWWSRCGTAPGTGPGWPTSSTSTAPGWPWPTGPASRPCRPRSGRSATCGCSATGARPR